MSKTQDVATAIQGWKAIPKQKGLFYKIATKDDSRFSLDETFITPGNLLVKYGSIVYEFSGVDQKQPLLTDMGQDK